MPPPQHAHPYTFKLRTAPIIEAVVDIDCDMPVGFQLASIQGAASSALASSYPKFRAQLVQEHQITHQSGSEPRFNIRQAVQALQFISEDEKQLVQIRQTGFSFNRLAPYDSLDTYLAEVERAWGIFRDIAFPAKVRKVALRYINRILLPMKDRRVELGDYLKVCPHLPDEERLTFLAFFNQHTAIEQSTGNIANIILTSTPPEDQRLPLIFDIEAVDPRGSTSLDWNGLLASLRSLRSLKNRVFQHTLTDKCLNQFQ